jgi:hypothetical protein
VAEIRLFLDVNSCKLQCSHAMVPLAGRAVPGPEKGEIEMRISYAMAMATLSLAAMAGANAQAKQLIVNGGFETGDYTGWSANVEPGSDGTLTVVPYSAGVSPISGFPFQNNPAGGTFFSITDQSGPGSYSLTQSFTLASASTVKVSFQMFANDQAGVIVDNGRDYNTFPNENAEVDILTGSADPFTNSASDIVSVLYGPGADSLSGNPNPWTSYSDTLSLAAGTYQIRFAETDNQGFFQQGVDNVSITTSVPEPASWALMLLGVGAVGVALRSGRRRFAGISA